MKNIKIYIFRQKPYLKNYIFGRKIILVQHFFIKKTIKLKVSHEILFKN